MQEDDSSDNENDHDELQDVDIENLIDVDDHDFDENI